MTNRLDGKVAVITGAASGIGAVTARRFVAEGCRVILGDIQTQEGQELADSLGDAALFCPCNVTSEKNVSTLVDLAVSSFGKLDIMFNNAGIVGSKGPIHTTPGEEWVATLDILVNGVFYGVKHAARVATTRLGVNYQYVECCRSGRRAWTSRLHCCQARHCWFD